MSHADKYTYFAYRLLDVVDTGDHAAYVALHREIEASEYDGVHVANVVAVMCLNLWRTVPAYRQQLDQMLEQARLDELNPVDPSEDDLFEER